MNWGCRPGKAAAVGSVRQFGRCCATPPIEVRHASGKPRWRHASALPARWVCAGEGYATAPAMSAHEQHGSRFPCPPWSARKGLRWPGNSWNTTSGTRRAEPSSPAFSRVSLVAVVAAMPCIGLRPAAARKIYYSRCLGSDAYRHAGQAWCAQKPIRQDLALPRAVWSEILRLLEDPTLIQTALNRRLESARHASPTRRRLQTLKRESARVRKHAERLLTAYQEELLSLEANCVQGCPPCANASRRFRRSFRP